MTATTYDDFFMEAQKHGLFFNRDDSEYITVTYDAENLMDGLKKYIERSRGKNIQRPVGYFLKMLKLCDSDEMASEQKPKRTAHYPFTDPAGVTWHSFDYAEKNGRWYRKDIVDNDHGGQDCIMRRCEKPYLESREEIERRVDEDKRLGIYQTAAQKFFDLLKHIVTKSDMKLLPAPEETLSETVPWEVP